GPRDPSASRSSGCCVLLWCSSGCALLDGCCHQGGAPGTPSHQGVTLVRTQGDGPHVPDQGVPRARREPWGRDARGMNTLTTPQVRFRTVDGVRVRYADSAGSHGPTILLTSPWPESLYAFTPMWDSLSRHARLFALDLPGFGASEAREDLLAPRAMGEFIA